MAFLERFKGKTSNLTKGGIISTVTTASVPVIKKVDNSRAQSYASPSLEDPSVTGSQLRFPQYNKSPSVEDDLIDATPNHKPFNPRFARSQVDEQQNHFLSRAPTDSFIYDRRAHTGQYNSTYAHSPNHRELINTYTGPRGESNFTKAHIDYSATFPHKFGNYSGSNSVRNNGGEQSSGKLKAFFHQYPQEPHSAGLKDRSNYSGSPRRDNYEEPNGHEARLSKFSFVERQKNMISKYRMREDREEERSYKSTGLSYSPEKASKLVFLK